MRFFARFLETGCLTSSVTWIGVWRVWLLWFGSFFSFVLEIVLSRYIQEQIWIYALSHHVLSILKFLFVFFQVLDIFTALYQEVFFIVERVEILVQSSGGLVWSHVAFFAVQRQRNRYVIIILRLSDLIIALVFVYILDSGWYLSALALLEVSNDLLYDLIVIIVVEVDVWSTKDGHILVPVLPRASSLVDEVVDCCIFENVLSF